MSISVRRAAAGDLDSAHAVWLAANLARNRPPSPQRIARVTAKLADSEAVVLVAVLDGPVIGMLQAEPGCDEAGELVADLGHVSMVFVDPSQQGQGVGGVLLAALVDAAADRGWTRLSLWTRSSNLPARRCYEKAGFAQTADSKQLPDGDAIDRWERVEPDDIGLEAQEFDQERTAR